MTGGKAPRAAGDRFERGCVASLRAHGYLVIRSAGSLGPADLVALRGDCLPLLISCKVTDHTTARDRGQFHAIAADAGAMAIHASRVTRGHIGWVRISDTDGTRVPYDIGGLIWPLPINPI